MEILGQSLKSGAGAVARRKITMTYVARLPFILLEVGLGLLNLRVMLG